MNSGASYRIQEYTSSLDSSLDYEWRSIDTFVDLREAVAAFRLYWLSSPHVSFRLVKAFDSEYSNNERILEVILYKAAKDQC